MKNKKILVIMGGTSSERDISLMSGEAVYDALADLNYNVKKFILDKDNAFEIAGEKPDLCVIMLHGKGGEDGAIQGMLELMNIPYTGSGLAASANCMNKILTKKLISLENIPTPEYAILKKDEDVIPFVESMLSNFDFPLVVKAPCQGSSVGVEIVKSKSELISAIENNINYDDEILIERFIKGTELTVPVMQDGNRCIALPIVEIVSENTFYDFESKYTAGMSHHIIPARIPEAAAERIEKYAISAYKAVGCKGVARIDFFIDENNNPYVIEINTIPGMTKTSLVPDSAAAAGISFGNLVEKIIAQSLD